MPDSAPMKVFGNIFRRVPDKPKVTGRPPKTSTLADLAPLPKGVQTRNPTRAKLPPLPPLLGMPGKR